MRYYRYRSDSSFRPGIGGFSLMPPVMKFLLISNTAIFLGSLVFGRFRFGGVSLDDISRLYFHLWPLGSGGFRPWQMITYMFIHANFSHIFFNMIMLWMFGVELEQVWGSKRFAFYYLLCGIGGALGQLFIAPLFTEPALTIGASGAIFGVLLAFGLMFPDRLIYFYFFIPVPAKYFMMIAVAFEVFAIGGSSGIAHLAHLGGAAMGLLYLLLEDKLPIDKMLDGFTGLFQRRSTPRSSGGGHKRVDAKYTDLPPESGSATQETIDRILDKISKTGYQNLTDEEKKILFEASKRIH